MFPARAKTPNTGSRVSHTAGFNKRRASQLVMGDYNSDMLNQSTAIASARDSAQSQLIVREGHLSVQDYVRQSVKRSNIHRSELNYQPTDSQLKKSII